MRGAALLVLVPLTACGGRLAVGGGGDPSDPAYQAEVIALAAQSDELNPGLASCLMAIGRPDLAADPDADMSLREIEALIGCTSERARG